MKRRVAILISGRGSNLAALVAASRDPAFPAEIVLVLSNRPDAAGLAFAHSAGIPALCIDHHGYGGDRAAHEAAIDAALRASGVEIVCLAGYMRLLTPFLVDAWNGRMLNIHPSLLPSFPGLHTHARALSAGVKLHGCTVHLVTQETDAGPILAQAAVPVLPGDTEDALAARVLRQEHAIYPAALAAFAAGAAATTAILPRAAASDDGADVTQALARHLAAARFEDLPETARKEASRSLLNWMAVAVGGSRHEAVEIALAAVAPYAGPPQAGVFGRKDRLDITNAALLNGISSHVFDFDDTDLLTAVHPSAPVVPALLALAEYRKIGGREFVNALVLGIEAECRIARCVTPSMQDVGWHATGTAGVFGAAAAAGKVLGLDAARMCHALGLAATQPVGLREMFGSMTKSFHPGRAAQSGLLAALLAEKGYTSSLRAIEARRGWANVLSTARNHAAITEDLGVRYEIFRNTYKPFACGLVVHPVIDGCIQLRNENALTADRVERIDLGIHPIVVELTSKRKPRTGLEGKFSVYHAAAIAIVAGRAGEEQFRDEAVSDPVVAALRDRVEVAVDASLSRDQARIKIQLKDGRMLDRFVVHALGSVENPLSDQQLDAKFLHLVAGILPDDRARRLMALCRDVENLDDVGDIARAAAA